MVPFSSSILLIIEFIGLQVAPLTGEDELDDAPPLLLLAVLLFLFFVGIFLLKPGIAYPYLVLYTSLYLGYNASIVRNNNQKYERLNSFTITTPLVITEAVNRPARLYQY